MTHPRLYSCLAFATLFVTASFAADWEQYRGNAGDGKSSEAIDASKPRVVWKTETPLGFSSFTISGTRAFTLIADGEAEFCLALNAQSGEEIWRVPLSSSKHDHGGGNAGAQGNKGGDGPRSTPSCDGTSVYVYDSKMVLSSLDAATGELNWQHDIVAEFEGRNIKWDNATSPVLDGDSLYVNGGGPGQSFLAFDKNSGRVLWKSGDELMTHATPSVGIVDGSKQLVFFTQFGLVSVDPGNGQEIWRTKFPFSVSTAASPILAGSLVYCSAGYGVGAGLFRVTGKGEPDEVWFKANELMNHWSTPIVKDGYLYGIYEFKKYGDAPLQCVELATGEIKWSHRGFGPGNCILVGDKLVVLSDAGELAIVKAEPDGYDEVARADVLEGKCWSTPAFSNGRIYVRSTVEAACIDLQ